MNALNYCITILKRMRLDFFLIFSVIAFLITWYITPEPSYFYKVLGWFAGGATGVYLGWIIGGIGVVLMGTGIGIPVGIVMIVLGAALGSCGGFIGSFFDIGEPKEYIIAKITFITLFLTSMSLKFLHGLLLIFQKCLERSESTICADDSLLSPEPEQTNPTESNA